MSLALNFKDGGVGGGILSERERRMMVEDVPNLPTYLSYMFFCGQSITGPFTEFTDFSNFINLRGHYSHLQRFESWPYAFTRYFHGITCAVVTLTITTYIVDPAYTITLAFVNDERGFFYKAWANMWAMQWQIWTYYCGFCWMEAA